MSARPTVLVGMPRYGDLSSGAAAGLYLPSGGAVRVWKAIQACNSIHTNAFNDLFLLALNAYDAGLITHFAMIHADVEPEGYWLDELWAEQEAFGADLMSAVVAVKEDEPDPPTSTAIGDRHNLWRVKRRFRRSDQHSLPETFGPKDVCGPDDVLLVNTGLWITDLSCPAWRNFPGFNCVTRIDRNQKNERVAECRPEDWEMSRYLDACGAKVMATWRVSVGHRGTKVWPNRIDPPATSDTRHPWAKLPMSRPVPQP